MDERATGLVLRTRPLTETSLVVHWLTSTHGRLATVARGAHRPKSPFRGKLDLFYLADFTFLRSRRSELHTLREVTLRESHSPLRRDFELLQQATYCVQLVEQVTETDTPLPGPFALVNELLEFLAQGPPSPVAVLAFEVKFLADAGLAPDLARVRVSAGAREILRQLGTASWTQLLRLKPSAAQTSELRQFLHGFLVQHLGRVPAGRARLGI